MKATTIQAEWDSYARAVMPPGVSAVQLTETRRAFYAGCRSLFTLLMTTVGSDAVSEAAGKVMIQRIDAELREFLQAIREGRA